MRILILTNYDLGLYKFRRELLEKLIIDEHEVFVCVPDGEYVERIKALGCQYVPCDLLDRHGTNPLKELQLLSYYQKLLRDIRPDIVLTYTIKPNAYGGIVCARAGVPNIATITGLHGAVEEHGLMQVITLSLYRAGVRNAQRVFFQNKKNLTFMQKHNIALHNYALVQGSGVNLRTNCFEPYPQEKERIIFLIIGRIVRIKGTEEILYAAEIVAREHLNVVFRFVGEYEEFDLQSRMEQAVIGGNVEYLGVQDNVHSLIKNSHATIHASYREGMSNALLESAAAGRPVLASNIPGCRETFDEGVSGIGFEPKNVDDLVRAIKEFIALPHEQKAAMGRAGREKMEREFDRQIVIDAYMREIHIVKENKYGTL
ncbi:MAG: glycosyltransferase family 4 protein [Lachnospiraceae bacterium]|nr:glycosyltransferase family 4 protein [Lachnospiraceae bacterium]